MAESVGAKNDDSKLLDLKDIANDLQPDRIVNTRKYNHISELVGEDKILGWAPVVAVDQSGIFFSFEQRAESEDFEFMKPDGKWEEIKQINFSHEGVDIPRVDLRFKAMEYDPTKLDFGVKLYSLVRAKDRNFY